MIRKLAMIALAAGIAFSPMTVLAQSANYDPCAIYPKNSAIITGSQGTATAALVAGVSGKAIYVCSVSVTETYLGTSVPSPQLILWYGTATTATATPCGTNSPFTNTQIGYFGGSGTTNAYGANGGTLSVVPAGAQLCGQAVNANGVFQSAIVTYVQIKQ
jgi:hypothetical protein